MRQRLYFTRKRLYYTRQYLYYMRQRLYYTWERLYYTRLGLGGVGEDGRARGWLVRQQQ